MLDEESADLIGLTPKRRTGLAPAPESESVPAPIVGIPSVMNAEDMGELFGIGEQMVTLLTRRGIIAKLGRGRFDVRASIRSYSAHLRQSASGRSLAGGSPELAEEKIRLVKEQADREALRNAEKRGELLPAADVKAEWASILTDVRAAMLAIPSGSRS